MAIPPPHPVPRDHTKDNRKPRARAVCRFGHGKAVRVIRAPDWTSHVPRQVAFKRLPVQPRGIGVLHQPRGLHDRSWNADTDRTLRADACFQRGGHIGNGLDGARVIFARRAYPQTVNLVAIRVKSAALNLCAAQVNPNT